MNKMEQGAMGLFDIDETDLVDTGDEFNGRRDRKTIAHGWINVCPLAEVGCARSLQSREQFEGLCASSEDHYTCMINSADSLIGVEI